MKNSESDIVSIIQKHSSISSRELHEMLGPVMAYATVKRHLAKLISEGLIIAEGKAKLTRYRISPTYQLFYQIDITQYFEKEIDEREIKDNFNFVLINEVLTDARLFTAEEEKQLNALQSEFKSNISQLSESAYNKELERLAIDLSWKSSQIEGNTYSLLETERLLKEKETAAGKPKDDAIMLLNHKEALNFIIAHPDYVVPLGVSRIEDIHSLLIKDLGIDRNIRQRRVGISGTNYRPLDNEHQIREALKDMCVLVNNKESVFEKAFLVLILLSYIQAFNDGNKRTARIISNAVLIAHEYCPISFRTIDSIEYKKAMLIFYEKNNISIFKQIFMSQFEFAVKNYF